MENPHGHRILLGCSQGGCKELDMTEQLSMRGDTLNYMLVYYNTAAAAAKSLQSCPTLCDPRDGSPPGPTVPGILQARTREWVAISSSSA